MLGQLRFALIDFKRSFLASSFSLLSQIITYSAITICIGIISFVLPFLRWSINDTFYRSYMVITILFVVVCIIIGGVVTSRSIDLKFQSQRDDIAVMKNVGGKSRWIYSYFIFNQLITAVIMLLLGIAIGAILILVVLAAFKNISFFSNIRFLPILGANIAILIVSYLKAHYTIIKFIGEKNFEESSSRLSNYKSIFEFRKMIRKFHPTIKLGIKNFLRSGKIISSFLFSFFLVFSSLSFVLGPLTISETHLYHIDSRYQNYSYIVGNPVIVDFYNYNMGFHPYTNESFTGPDDLDYPDFFSDRTLKSVFINELDSLGIPFQELFISKIEVKEIPHFEIIESVYNYIGSDRSFYATVIGYEENFIPENLFLWGENPDPAGRELLVGDSLERVLFENSTLEKLRFIEDSYSSTVNNGENRLTANSNKFSVSGSIIDCFASGFTIYLPINRLKLEGITDGPNTIMFGNISSKQYNEINEIAEGFEYKLEDISEIIETTKSEYKMFSSMFTSLGAELFIIFSFQIVVFSFLYFLSYRKDFDLLYDLGIAKKKIYGISISATMLQMIPGMILGIYFGSILARFFLVPNAQFSYYLVALLSVVVFYILISIVGSIIAGIKGLGKHRI